MRAINSAGQALLARALAGEQIGISQHVECRFAEGTLYLTTGNGPEESAGHTWTPAGLGQIEAIADSANEMPSLGFTLPGINEQQRAVALEPGTSGKVVIVYDALVDKSTGVVVDSVRCWVGSFDVPTMTDGRQADLSVTAEHRGMLAIRPKPSRYTDDEQQRRYPGDTSLRFDPATDAGAFPWPSAAAFRI